MGKTSGIILIGNEILSGKIQDINASYLCRELRGLGVDVRRISVIPDEVNVIGAEVTSFSQLYDYVFTSGGVGPTHDDVTMEGIAAGFGVKVVRHPVLRDQLSAFYRGNLTEARLKMAEVPEGGELLAGESLLFPLIVFKNVYIFPGIPEILQQKFEAVKERFREEPYYLRNLFVRMGEGSLAEYLNNLLREYPELMVGSYPVLDNPEYKVKVTLESKDSGYLNEAFQAFVTGLPSDAVVRVE